ncbi:hypothetical protein [Blautia wexlerae]|uniref:hypothetical protein n=1 Tax=Blautia wexlerae TaxID=418240 RepID=UPI001360E750|nr:hypothetical protein [Blautia wexlerae]MZT02011.1 hypothetical protein [Blautia wexlerae]MZT05799.1 hypothetical protein [Blautia wexlerae]MZT39279.1 hypothetical protein [Blautia wexlerae]
MNNVEVEQITDKYAYMNAKTFKEFLKLYPLSSTYEWAGMLLKWLVFTYVDDFETFRHFVLLPHRLAWNNGEIDIYEDNSVLDFIYEVDSGCGDRHYIGDNSATLDYEWWRNREDTICWISWYWFEDDIVEPLFADRSDMTEDDKQQWEESYYNITWVVWRVVDNGKTAGEEIIDAIYSKQCILIAILDWTEKNADKLQ